VFVGAFCPPAFFSYVSAHQSFCPSPPQLIFSQLVFDLGARATLQRIDYRIDGATNLALAVSLDGLQFAPVGSLPTAWGLRSASVSAFGRWIRLRITTDANNAWARVFVSDVQFFG
jgi:hypothetical protein